MASDRRGTRDRAAALAPYAALAAATLLIGAALRYPSLSEPRWYGDEGIFAAIAQNLRHGRTLYAQAWDNKPPLMYVTYAAIQQALGTSVFALHLVTSAVVLAAQGSVMAVAALIYGRRRALVAGLLFALAMDTPVIEGNLAMTETFMLLPTTLAVLAYVLAERRATEGRPLLYAVAGALLGVAAGFKQVAVFDLAALATFATIAGQRPLRALAPMGAGFAAVQAAIALYFAAAGAFGGYWYAVAGSLGLYGELAPAAGPFVRASALLPALLVVAWLTRRRARSEPVTLALLPPLWLALALGGATASTFPFPHYLQQAAPAAALTVAGNPLRFEREGLSRALLAVTAVLIVAVAAGQFAVAFRERRQVDPVRYYRTFVQHRFGTMNDLQYDYAFDGKAIAVRDIVHTIAADGAGTTVFTWSELPWLYAAGGYTNPTRYYTSFLGELIPGAKPQIMQALERQPPAYIVVSDSAYAPFGALRRFTDGRYVLVRAQGDWRVYRLASLPGRLASPGRPAAAGERRD